MQTVMIILMILIGLSSLVGVFYIALSPILPHQKRVSTYKKLVEQGVVLLDGLKQARHGSMENIEQLYDAIKGWERHVIAVTRDLPQTSKQRTRR